MYAFVKNDSVKEVRSAPEGKRKRDGSNGITPNIPQLTHQDLSAETPSSVPRKSLF